jgi:methylated-DNA-protein-cysteine methyltransferase related protein
MKLTNLSKTNLKIKVFELVNKIPKQKVAFFGLIANILGSDARTIGWILSGMKKEEWEQIPWYRVVAKNGFISSLKLGEKGLIQKEILKNEGYEIIDDKINMQKHCLSLEELQNN